MPPKPRTVEQVIDHLAANSVFTDDGCIEWTAGTIWSGYGNMSWKPAPGAETSVRLAHRIAYHVLVEPLPIGGHQVEVDHLCRNRLCINPDHLEAVSSWENQYRGNGAASLNVRKTHCPQGHVYDEANTRWTNTTSRNPFRQCRTCVRTQTNARRARQRLEAAS